jgi:hypothetical protein
VLLCGGPSAEERRMGDAILSHMRSRDQVTGPDRQGHPASASSRWPRAPPSC